MRPLFQGNEPLTVEGPFGGLNDTDPITRVGPTEATLAENVTFDRGLIENSRGRVQIGNQINFRPIWGGYEYRRSDGVTRNLVAAGDKLYRYDPVQDLWVGAVSGTVLGDSTDSWGNDRTFGCWGQYADIIFYADGDNQRTYDGTSIRPWSYDGGESPAPTIVTPGFPIGAMTSGDYSIRFTLYDPGRGEETNPSAVSNVVTAVTGSESYFEITINPVPNWNSNYSQIRLYRTTADGAGAWFREKTIEIPPGVDLSTTALTTALQAQCHISAADSSLGSQLSFDNDPVPMISFFVIHNERFVGSGIASEPSAVRWTPRNNPYSWSVTNEQQLIRRDGRPVTALFTLYGSIFAWKRDGPGFRLSEHPTIGYSQSQLPARHGCEYFLSVVPDENHAVFVDRDGFVQFNGQQTENISDPKIRKLFAEIANDTENFFSHLVGIHDQQPDRQRMRWFVASETVGIGGREIRLDRKTGAWHVGRPNVERDIWVAWPIRERGRNIIYGGDPKGRVFRLRYDTDGSELYSIENNGSIPFKWYSKWFGDGATDMLIPRFEVTLERSARNRGLGNVTVKFWADGGSVPYHEETFPLWALGEDRPAVLSQWYEVGENPVTYTVPFDLTARYMSLVRVGFEHDTAGGHVPILRFTLHGKAVGRRLEGVS